MSSTAELQKLFYDTLRTNTEIMALANGVYDRPPAAPFGTKTAYITLGSVDGGEDDSDCISGVRSTTQIDIWSRAVGAVECKRLTDLVRRALHRQSLTLTENALVDTNVELWFVRADPDGLTTHGVVQVTAMIEE